ncbi:Rpp14/Pop5 family protein [Haloarcula amylovorans]|uniref:Rpp14/Pop5 family protein n=1 Tax=Haloarcula amylovorans TaxID=2562280 RepID=UPI001076ADF1|nr:Rpp14/Pop5 family protein [Halomicroarcula amylolytica]
MKHLPKHLRPRWRYLAVCVETLPDADVDRRAFQREVWYAAQNLLGDPGSADADMTVIRFAHDDGTGHAIVRVRRGHTDEARAALACIDAIDGQPVGLRVTGTSGTVRACEEKYIGGPGEPFEQRHVVFENAERHADARGKRVDVRTDDAFVGATDLDFR